MDLSGNISQWHQQLAHQQPEVQTRKRLILTGHCQLGEILKDWWDHPPAGLGKFSAGIQCDRIGSRFYLPYPYGDD